MNYILNVTDFFLSLPFRAGGLIESFLGLQVGMLLGIVIFCLYWIYLKNNRAKGKLIQFFQVLILILILMVIFSILLHHGLGTSSAI